MESDHFPPLVLWAGCVSKRDLLERADAVTVAGFSSMSLFMKDLLEWEERGGTVGALSHEFDAREARVSCLDPYLGWYPGFDPRDVQGERAAFVRASENDVFRFADAFGVPYVNLVAPYRSDDPPPDAVVGCLGEFADRAATAGLRLHLEVVPTSLVPDVGAATGLVTTVGRPNLGLLLDTYNLARAGTEPRELDAVPLELVFAMQLADGTADPAEGGFSVDSLHHRRQPGEGELNVAALSERVLRARPLPPVGPEVITDELAELPALPAARRCAEATRRFLAALPEPTDGSA